MEDFKIEEYKEIRNEIRAREYAIAVFFQIALISSITILSGLSTFFFSLKLNELQNINIFYAYVFLSPLAIILPIFRLIISHRQDMHRSGTYLQVFFENDNLGPLWETRLTEFRKYHKNESLNFLPWTFWGIFVLSFVLFVTALYSIPNSNVKAIWVVLLPILFTILNIIAHKRYSSFDIRQDYFNTWKRIKNERANKNGKTGSGPTQGGQA